MTVFFEGEGFRSRKYTTVLKSSLLILISASNHTDYLHCFFFSVYTFMPLFGKYFWKYIDDYMSTYWVKKETWYPCQTKY